LPRRFRYLCPLDDHEISEVWNQGTFVFDTNIFLNIYRLAENPRKIFLEILKNKELLERTWVPFQVALEFYERRLLIINKQLKTKEALVSIISKGIERIKNEFDKLHKLHPFIDKHYWQEKFDTLKINLARELDELALSYPMSLTEDQILATIQEIMEGRIGNDVNEMEKKQLYKEADERCKNFIPPGYRDSKNGDNINKYGDFLIWKQIISEMKNKKSHAIFITDDIKDDWWYRPGGKLIGARPELRREFTEETGKELLLYTMERFIKRANEIIKEPIDKDELGKLIKNSIMILRSQHDLLSNYGVKDEELSPLAKAMVKWFFDNYEDPANGVPFDSEEGGYQFVFGGPYYAKDELEEKFPEASEEDIEEAVDYINPFGWEWVKVGEY